MSSTSTPEQVRPAAPDERDRLVEPTLVPFGRLVPCGDDWRRASRGRRPPRPGWPDGHVSPLAVRRGSRRSVWAAMSDLPLHDRSATDLAAAIRRREAVVGRGRRGVPAAHRGGQPAHQRGRPARGRVARSGRRPTRRSTRRGSTDRCTASRSRSRTRSTRPASSRRRARSAGRTACPSATRRSSRGCRAAGGILLGKTNTPEFTWANEADNLVYGRTSNPYDLDRSPGGSSGGSAAIVAAGGSPFDIGSDTGDSIRQPSHVCGVAGLKPTSGRVPRTGHCPVVPRHPGVADPARTDRPPGRGPRADPADHRRTGRRGPARRPGAAPRPGGGVDRADCESPGSPTTACRRRRPRRWRPSERLPTPCAMRAPVSRSGCHPTRRARRISGIASSTPTGMPGCDA